MRTADELAKLEARPDDPEHRAGDPETAAAYLRVHFRPALHQSELLDGLIARLRVRFTKEELVKARAIEERLYEETWFDQSGRSSTASSSTGRTTSTGAGS